MRKLSKLTVISLTFVLVGIGAFATVWIWESTRVELPVSIPISLSKGKIQTQQFTVNLNRPYIIGIEARKTLPFDEENCLLGIALELPSKCKQESIVQTT